LRSGRHGSAFFDGRAVMATPALLEAASMRIIGLDVFGQAEVIVGRGNATVELATLVAQRHLDFMPSRLMIRSQPRRKQGERVVVSFEPFHAAKLRGQRVVFVEDVATTSTTCEGVIRGIRRCGGEVTGGIVILNRGEITAEQLGIPEFESVIPLAEIGGEEQWQSWTSDKCPLCAAGQPLEWVVDDQRGFLVPTK